MYVARTNFRMYSDKGNEAVRMALAWTIDKVAFEYRKASVVVTLDTVSVAAAWAFEPVLEEHPEVTDTEPRLAIVAALMDLCRVLGIVSGGDPEAADIIESAVFYGGGV